MNGQNDLIHGVHPVVHALRNPRRRIVRILATKNGADRIAAELAARAMVAETVQPRELDRLLGADTVHQGVLLEAEPLQQPSLGDIDKTGTAVLLDQVTDPHNVGAILRSCAALKVSGLVTTARHSPQASGVLFKAASGAFEHVPYVRVGNLARAMEEMKDFGYTLLGLDGDAPETIGDRTWVNPVGIVLGAEGKGLRQLTRQRCDALVRLELDGPINSLNVSNAAAIALYALAGARR